MNFDLYLKTRKTFPSPEGPAVVELWIDNTGLTDFETLLESISAGASHLLSQHDKVGLAAWASSFVLLTGERLSCAITKEWFPEKQVIACVTELKDVFSKRFEDEEVQELICKYFDLSSILLDDNYEIQKEDINDSSFFENLFEASDIIDSINLLLKPDYEESLRIYCEDRHCGLDYISSLNPKRFYNGVVVYKDKEDYARNYIDEPIPSIIENNINWEGVYDNLTSYASLELVEHEGTIYDFTNI